MNDSDIKKCKKNGYVWVSDDEAPYKIRRDSGGTRWKATLRQINKPCMHPTRAAAQAAIDERNRLARLAEYRKSMESITPEQAKDYNDADFQRGILEGMRAANKAQRTFSTGAVRDTDTGKPRMDLIPPEALEALGHVLAEGAKHYGTRNWEKGIPLSEFMASAERHRCKVMRGEHDEDHDRRWLWNAMAFVTIAERVKSGKLPAELDDIGWTKEGKVR